MGKVCLLTAVILSLIPVLLNALLYSLEGGIYLLV